MEQRDKECGHEECHVDCNDTEIPLLEQAEIGVEQLGIHHWQPAAAEQRAERREAHEYATKHDYCAAPANRVEENLCNKWQNDVTDTSASYCEGSGEPSALCKPI